MTRADIERYIRRQTEVTTDADRDRYIDRLTRYPAELNSDRDLSQPTSYAGTFFSPPTFWAADTTTVAAPTSNQANAMYLGQANTDKNLVTVRMLVTTAGSTITWAEIAICTSLEATLGANADLSLNGYTGVAGTFNSTGIKDTEVSVSISRGAHVWCVWGSNAVTPFAVRGGLADPLTTGRMQFASATRPSTMSDPTTFTASTSASLAAWMAIQW